MNPAIPWQCRCRQAAGAGAGGTESVSCTTLRCTERASLSVAAGHAAEAYLPTYLPACRVRREPGRQGSSRRPTATQKLSLSLRRERGECVLLPAGRACGSFVDAPWSRSPMPFICMPGRPMPPAPACLQRCVWRTACSTLGPADAYAAETIMPYIRPVATVDEAPAPDTCLHACVHGPSGPGQCMHVQAAGPQHHRVPSLSLWQERAGRGRLLPV